MPTLSLDRFAHSGETHLNLLAYAALLQVAEEAVGRAPTDALERFPVLAGHLADLAALGLDGMEFGPARRLWLDALGAWERAAPTPLPLTRLRAAGLGDDDLLLLTALGLPDQEPRLGPVFEWLADTPGQRRPAMPLLHEWAGGSAALRRSLYSLRRLGLLAVGDSDESSDAPRPHPLLWDALHGNETLDLPQGMTWAAPDSLPALADLILSDEARRRAAALPEMGAAARVRAVAVRGPRHNGRRTLLQAIARAAGRSALLLDATVMADATAWQQAGTLALLRDAMPIIALDLEPGEATTLPPLAASLPLLGVTLGRTGALEPGPHAPLLTLELPLPAAPARRRLWQAALPAALADPHALDMIAAQARLSSGSIRRAAADVALLAADRPVTLRDVRRAGRNSHAHRLERLAAPLPPLEDWARLALCAETQRDLRHLELRIRHRETMAEWSGAALPSPGVRALLSGPSGTGKTLAARAVAAAVEMEIYRADLSTIVNKYIGETEKNLNRLFSQAEELDVILLLDEGDALLTQRTQVGSANDRYANLETNYLLQRLEAYEGVLLVTTNAGDRIDSAFQRRMDAVIEFRAPDATERWTIWEIHLPAGHAVDGAFLQEVAVRCALTGGQIRNAAQHALLLALESGAPLAAAHLETAVQREYRKAGSLCPLRARPASRTNGHAVYA